MQLHDKEKFWLVILLILVAIVAFYLFNNQSTIKTGLIGGESIPGITVKLADKDGYYGCPIYSFNDGNPPGTITVKTDEKGACVPFSLAMANMRGSTRSAVAQKLFDKILACLKTNHLFIPGKGVPHHLMPQAFACKAQIMAASGVTENFTSTTPGGGFTVGGDAASGGISYPSYLAGCPPNYVGMPIIISYRVGPNPEDGHVISCYLSVCPSVQTHGDLGLHCTEGSPGNGQLSSIEYNLGINAAGMITFQDPPTNNNPTGTTLTSGTAVNIH